MRIILNLATLSMLAVSCSHINDSYYNVPYVARDSISLSISILDTLRIDGSTSSLSGIWLTNGNSLYFSDKNMVSIKRYDMDGQLLERIIRSGRGPGEWHSPLISFCFDSIGRMYCVDGMWNILSFSPDMHLSEETFRMFESGYASQNWSDLFNHPDPENVNMYEYNVDKRGLVMMGEKLVFPIVTDHMNFNGYNTHNHSKQFWRDSYNMMYIMMNDESRTSVMFSHFPKYYQTGNYPLFADYSFDVRQNNQLLISYMADPKIYVFDSDCQLSYSFGAPSRSVSTRGYRQSQSYDEYGNLFSTRLTGISAYGKIKCIDDYTFRTYKGMDDIGYGLQIYHGDVLVGDIKTYIEWSVIGKIGDTYYASISSDYKNEEHLLIRFKTVKNDIL